MAKKKHQRRPGAKAASGAFATLIRQATTQVESCDWPAAEVAYEKALEVARSPKERALVFNNLGALAATGHDRDRASELLAQAQRLEAGHRAAGANTALLRQWEAPEVSGAPPQDTVEPAPNVTRVAILSLFFNWPTTGGGNVHTVELARFLSQAGYCVRHFFARHDAWNMGQVDATCPFPSEPLEFAEGEWAMDVMQHRFREKVRDFHPDYVIVSDSWNSKPLLAEAVSEFPYFLRLQALECLCPLNNIRLLPDGRQCARHQLATPDHCRACVADLGQWSGPLHRAERELCDVDRPAYSRQVRRAFEQAEAVLVVNPLSEAMVGPYTRQVRVIPSGFDPQRFPWPWPTTNGQDHGKLRIFVAALVQEGIKGVHIVHEACRRLWEKRQDFELLLTADPPGRVDAFTRYVGWQSQADLPAHMRQADIVVTPAVAQEALGRTAVEAMGVGRPVIASRIGGLPYTIADGAGLLFEPNDADDLASKIETLLDDAALRTQMGLLGRRRFDEHFIWPAIIEKHYLPLLGPPVHARYPTVGFRPMFVERVDQERMLRSAAELFEMPVEQVSARWEDYEAFSRENRYAERFGERKTLCTEEAFLLALAIEQRRPRRIVEIGVQQGKSTRRILDTLRRLQVDCRVVGFDMQDSVQHFAAEEASLVVEDVTGRFRRSVLEAFTPDLLLLDVHAHDLLQEAIRETIACRPNCLLAIHDCGRGLCNPRMTLRPEDPDVTSATGAWERHMLARQFGIANPLSRQLDHYDTSTHQLRIFDTPHGLALIVPTVSRRVAPTSIERTP